MNKSRLFKKIDNFIWPNYDSKLSRAVREVRGLNDVLPLVKQKRSAIQAGGACGIWAKKLSLEFDQVYTFEPDPLNFFCLCQNTKRCFNIIKFQSALGESHRFVELANKNHNNAGSIYVMPSERSFTPMLTIDDLNLESLDFLCLDIEGWEFFALKGAKKTIEKCNPIIQLEVKPLKHNHNIFDGEVVAFDSSARYLADLGYKEITRVRKDVVFSR